MAGQKHPVDIQQLDIDEAIDLLVENELSPDDRRRLFSRLDAVENGWRQCAVAFINGQTLHGDLRDLRDRNLKSVGTTTVIKKFETPRRRQLSWPMAIAASILLVTVGAALSALWNRMVDTPRVPATEQLADVEIPIERELELIAGFNRLARGSSPVPVLAAYQAPDLSGTFAQLIEVQNDEQEAVYYTTGFIPEFILESIILAGHQITVEPETIQIPVHPDRSVQIHVNAVRISKNALDI